MPQWCIDLLPTGPPASVTRHTVRENLERGGWVMGSLELSVRRVCRSCNNEWMAKLEERAAPVLRPLIASITKARLQEIHLRLIATWITKMALLSQLLTERDPPIIPARQYRWFYEHQLPFPDSVAWLGAYRLKQHSPFSTSSVRIGSPEARAWRTTVNVGALVFQLIVLPGAGHVLRPVRPPREIRRFLVRLYPRRRQTLRWPPRRVMEEHDLHVVSAIEHDSWRDWRN